MSLEYPLVTCSVSLDTPSFEAKKSMAACSVVGPKLSSP